MLKVKIKRKEKSTIKEVWKQQWNRMKFLYFGITLYLVLMELWFRPVVLSVFESILKQYGYSYITAEMMLSFFSKPVVVLFIVGVLLLIAGLYSLVYLLSYHYARYMTMDFLGRLWASVVATLQDSWRLLKNKNIGIVIIVMVNVILQNIVLLFLACNKIPTWKYVANNFMKLEYAKEVIAVVILLLFFFGWRHIYTLPYMLCDKQNYKQAGKSSRRLVAGKRIQISFAWVFWTCVSTIISVVFYYIIMGMGVAFVGVFVEEKLRIAVIKTFQEHAYFLTFLVSVVFGTIMHICDNVQSFYERRVEAGEIKHVEEEVEEEKNKLLHRRFVALFVMVVLIVDIVVSYDRIQNGENSTFAHMGSVKITSHRGDSKSAPENTLEAIDKALATNADFVEIDVQLTKDGQVVLMHDDTLARTARQKGGICDYTLEQLENFDVGSWFSKEYAGAKIPTLREVLELCKGRMKLNIEIKTNKRTPDLESKLVELIEEYDFTRQCVVTSVYKKSLKKVKALNKEIRTGYILSSAYGRYYLDKEIDFFSMRKNLISERVVRMSHKYGKEVCVWTVNSKEDAIVLTQLGVDNLITDRPVYIRNVLYEQEGHVNVLNLLKQI